MILRKKIYCKSTKNEWKGSHSKIVWLNFVLLQDSWQQLRSDSISWPKTLKNSHNFTETVACREYTLPRDEKSSDPKGWIRGNTKIGPVLKVTTSYQQGKYGVEIRIESFNKDNFHSWVRISHGLNQLVTDLSNNKENDNNEQETSEMHFEDFALKTNVLAFASRSKAKAKPQRRTLCQLIFKNYTHRGKKVDWFWARRLFGCRLPSVKTTEYSSLSWSSTSRRWWWAIEFLRVKEYLRNDLERSQHWSGEKWKSTMAKCGGNMLE